MKDNIKLITPNIIEDRMTSINPLSILKHAGSGDLNSDMFLFSHRSIDRARVSMGHEIYRQPVDRKIDFAKQH
jgi:hypothetical protein